MAKTDVVSTYKLPKPCIQGEFSLEHCLHQRRSVRDYRTAALTVGEVGQLLWAAQGITANGGLRTAPSAGALYPLDVYLVAGNVDGLPAGVYRYYSDQHELVLAKSGDLRQDLAEAALGQDCVRDSAVTIMFAAVYARATGKYGQRGLRYVHIEVGHAAQNVCLQATTLGLGAVTVGAFKDEDVKRLTEITEEHDAVYLIPVGRQ